MEKKEIIRSVCRLISLNQDSMDEQLRGHKIDQIRKKLRVICSITDKKDQNKQQQSPTRRNSVKKSPFITLLYNRHKFQQTPYPPPPIPIQQSAESSSAPGPLKLRKIQTEYKQLLLAQSTPIRLQQKMASTTKMDKLQLSKDKDKDKQNLNLNLGRISGTSSPAKTTKLKICNVRQMLLISQKCINHRKSTNKEFRVSQELKSLKKQRDTVLNRVNENVSYDWVLQNKNMCSQSEESRPTKCNSGLQVKNQEKEVLSGKNNNNKAALVDFRVKNNHKKISLNSRIYSKYREFLKFVGHINGIYTVLSNQDTASPFKFYVGKGNNQGLPKKLLKKRKWLQTNRIKDANFVWSQRRDQKYFQLMQAAVFQTYNETRLKNPNSCFTYKCTCKNKQKPQQCKCSYRKLILSSELDSKYKITQIQNKPNIFRIKLEQAQQKTLTVDSSTRIHNHLFFHQQIAYKRLLFTNLKVYYQSKKIDPFLYIPVTFHVSSLQDDNWLEFLRYYRNNRNKRGDNCLWIVKPGENTNRGVGIKVQSDLQNIKYAVLQKIQNNSSAIVQLYITPLLYNKRKFDIRCYAMVTVINSEFKAYWYEEGYGRTSCKLFSFTNTQNKFIHLTNDAIQKHCPDYGKFQPGNKLSFDALSCYIQSTQSQIKFDTDIYPQMVSLTTDIFQCSYNKLHLTGKDFCFQIFGLDFMIDSDYKVWLIEVNRNPCLETSTLLLARLIGQMMENAFKIAVDPIFHPSNDVLDGMEGNFDVENKFKLILSKKLSANQTNQKPPVFEMSSDSQHDQ